jgi:hypothetical protein
VNLQSWHAGPERLEWEKRTGRLKLDAEKVGRLRSAKGTAIKALAKEFGISEQTAMAVRRRAAWWWVSDTEKEHGG